MSTAKIRWQEHQLGQTGGYLPGKDYRNYLIQYLPGEGMYELWQLNFSDVGIQRIGKFSRIINAKAKARKLVNRSLINANK